MPKKIEKSNEAEQIKQRAEEKPDPIRTQANEGDFSSVVSTGSTLLDLAISGGRVRGGGIPSGILLEIYGPSGTGKTSIVAEMCADSQIKGGNVVFLDPEARLDQEYMKIYGMEIERENYHRPDTVTEVFDHIFNWTPDPPPEETANVIATDSLAALSTELELGDGDKMGMKRAKEFSEGLRKTCRLIKHRKTIVACTNQIRGGTSGEFTPGGQGIPFYSSLRIRVGPPAQNKYIKSEKTIHGKKHSKILGIQSICTVKKSSIDDPFRTANIYIVFGFGIDDIRANLIYNKQVTGTSTYNAVNKKFGRINDAIYHIEENNFEEDLKNMTIDLWEEIENKFKIERKPKKRGI